MEIAPLPTTFNGVTYRSRTEARWAVFFCALGLRYSYEYEGFDLTSLASECGLSEYFFGPGPVRYLPDFYIHDLSMWVEVKPTWPNDAAAHKLALLTRATGEYSMMVIGPPDPQHPSVLFLEYNEDSDNEWRYYDFLEPSNTELLVWRGNSLYERYKDTNDVLWPPRTTFNFDNDLANVAFHLAMTHRFGVHD